MNVVYYSSNFFSEMCGVAIQSLCENNQDSDVITIYVIEDDISEENKNRLCEITDHYNRNIVFIEKPLQQELYPDVKYDLGHTYARMAMAELLPESVERVLSLDSDTLVVNSLSDMYNIEFAENEYVAGVYDCVGRAVQENLLHASKVMKYCNVGMLLIDLKKWRKKNVGKQLLDVVLSSVDGKQNMYFLEQDMMNIVFEGHLKLIDPCYNMLTSIYLFDYDEIIQMKHPVSYYSKDVVNRAKKHPVLLHATTCFYVKRRMWVQDSDSPYAKFYLYYRRKTAWGDIPQSKDNRKFSKRLYGSFWHCMPRGVAVWVASLLINYIRPGYAYITMRANLPTIANQS